MMNRTELENQVCVLLAGRAAELLTGGPDALTAGASNDLERAAEIVSAMVTELGMAGEPAVSLKALARSCGGVGDAAERCRGLLGALYVRTEKLLADHADALKRLSDALLERETLDEAEIADLLADVSNENSDSTKVD